MEDPRTVEKILSRKTHAVSSDRTLRNKSKEKKYKYYLEFDEYKSFKLIYKQVKKASEESGVALSPSKIEPVVSVSESTIKARVKVTVQETKDRYETEHVKLEQFETSS